MAVNAPVITQFGAVDVVVDILVTGDVGREDIELEGGGVPFTQYLEDFSIL